MAGEIIYYGRDGQAGLTLTATVHDDTGAVHTSSISLVESPTNVYKGNMPSAVVGAYVVVILETTVRKGVSDLFWDGTQEVNSAYLRKLLANRRTTNDSTGELVILDDNNSTVLVSGPLWEDVARTSTYDSLSTGIRVQDQLS